MAPSVSNAPDRMASLGSQDLSEQIDVLRHDLGDQVVILGHHYQKDEIIRHADFRGDSLKLSQLASERVSQIGAKYIVFCGVHFMAESADLLAPPGTAVILPDMAAGCSMAEMADVDDVEEAWSAIHAALGDTGWHGRIIPVTYVNSSAAVKAFTGRHGGACCTSSNAANVLRWALGGGDEPANTDEDIKVLFLPDQHLGRNTASGLGIDTCLETCVYDYQGISLGDSLGGLFPSDLRRSKIILWAGHCSVHMRFRTEDCDAARSEHPGVQIMVHPECRAEVVAQSDLVGSTEFIIRTIRDSIPGDEWAIGTEVHLVNRLAHEAAQRDVRVRLLSQCQCLCTTMYRIDPPQLLNVLENLANGVVVNQVTVPDDQRAPALQSLERMLRLTTPIKTD